MCNIMSIIVIISNYSNDNMNKNLQIKCLNSLAALVITALLRTWINLCSLLEEINVILYKNVYTQNIDYQCLFQPFKPQFLLRLNYFHSKIITYWQLFSHPIFLPPWSLEYCKFQNTTQFSQQQKPNMTNTKSIIYISKDR